MSLVKPIETILVSPVKTGIKPMTETRPWNEVKKEYKTQYNRDHTDHLRKIKIEKKMKRKILCLESRLRALRAELVEFQKQTK